MAGLGAAGRRERRLNPAGRSIVGRTPCRVCRSSRGMTAEGTSWSGELCVRRGAQSAGMDVTCAAREEVNDEFDAVLVGAAVAHGRSEGGEVNLGEPGGRDVVA